MSTNPFSSKPPFEFVEHRLKTRYSDGMARTYRFADGTQVATYIVGQLSDVVDGPLVRVHDECLWGEAFGSEHCDCGPQIDAALRKIAEEGCGMLIYTFQEGRGAGLWMKALSYVLETEGNDTVEAYEALHLPSDGRIYDQPVVILKHLGITHLRLMTNNPKKLRALVSGGLDVAQVPLQVGLTATNRSYLQTKQIRMNHMMSDVWLSSGKHRLAIVGGAVQDVVTRIDRMPAGGNAVQSRGQLQMPGGKGLSLALSAARLGATAHFVGVFGEDASGRQIKTLMNHEEVQFPETSCIKGAQTPVVMAFVDADGVTTHIGNRNLAHLRFVPEHFESIERSLGDADALIVTLEPHIDDVVASVGMAKKRGLPIVLLAAPLPQESEWATLRRLVSHVDLLVTTQEIASELVTSSMVSAEHLASRLNELGAGVACVESKNGTYAVASNAGSEIVDTVQQSWLDSAGSLDAFTVSLALDLLAGVLGVDHYEHASAAATLARLRWGGPASVPRIQDVDFYVSTARTSS